MADYGQTSQGRSLDNVVGAGGATFYIPRTTHNVIVGFAPANAPNSYNASHVKFGVYALSGFLARFEDGQQYSNAHPLGSYTGEDEIRVEFNGVSVRIFVGGDLRDEFAYAVAPNEELYLFASFARPDDLIHTPALYDRTSVAPSGSMDVVLPTLSGFMSEAATYAQIDAQMPAMGGSMSEYGPEGSLAGTMPVMESQIVIGPGSGATMHVILPPLQGLMDGTPMQNPPVYIDAVLPSMESGMYSVTGGVIEMHGTMPSGGGFMADRIGGFMDVTLPGMSGLIVIGTGPSISSFPMIEVHTWDAQSFVEVTTDFPTITVLEADFGTVASVTSSFDTTVSLGADFASDAGFLAVFDTVEGHSVVLDSTITYIAAFDTIEAHSTEWAVILDPVIEGISCEALSWRVSSLTDADKGPVVWALNVASGGSTRYTSYPFNSFARIGDSYYGAGQGGLYLLDGPDDAGAEIASVIDLGRLDFGSAQKMTVAQCYVGMAGEAPLLLSVDAEGATFVYPTRSYSEHLQQQRITLGKGLRTNYVNVRLMNQDGADFEVDGVQLVVADLTRRI